MIRILFFFAIILFVLAWLMPIHALPWVTFESEILVAISALFICFSVFYINKNISIPRTTIIFTTLIFFPLLQYFTGQVLYLSTSLLGGGYLLIFFMMVISGYNLRQRKMNIFLIISYVFIFLGSISSFISILQWLGLDVWLSPFVIELRGERPYANLAQPNILASLLVLSLLSVIYIYEKRKFKSKYLFFLVLLISFGLILAQSRTSWISIVVISIYIGYKNKDILSRLSLKINLLFLIFFALSVFLFPYINKGLWVLLGRNDVNISTIEERVSSGYLRIDMWNQALLAISESPWFGYGWNQTGLAQMTVFDTYPTTEWYKSAHNIGLDLLLWLGLPVGLFFIIYFLIGLKWLSKRSVTTENIIGFSMIIVMFIHGMLEFPLHYSFFLFPLGFIIGLIYPDNLFGDFNINRMILLVPVIVLLGFIYFLVKDYYLYKEKIEIMGSNQSVYSEMDKNILSKELLVLTEFRKNLWWESLNPKSNFSDIEINQMRIYVWNHASQYNLYKYAQILAFNNRKEEALKQLWIISKLHKKKYSYNNL